RRAESALQPVIEFVLGGAGRGQRLCTQLVAGGDRVCDITDLGLDHEHHRVVSQPGVGPQQKEQVGHVGDGDPAVRADALAVPPVHQVLAVQPLDLDVCVGVGDVEAGGIHDHVGLAVGAVGSHDAVGGDSCNVVGDQFGLG